MITIISPAKSMDSSKSENRTYITTPLFNKEACFIASKMARYSKEEIKKMFKVSDTIAETTYQRYRDFSSDSNAPTPAITTYTGSVFKKIAPQSLSKEDLEFANDHLLIISVLYGLTRPLDGIKGYRLEYKTRIEALETTLYNFWRPRLTPPLIDMLRGSGNILINLSSLDILPALEMDKIERESRVITPEFKTLRGGEYINIQTYSKMARGAMSRYIIKNRIEDPEKLKRFDWDGYSFNETISGTDNYVFTRV